jgi:hypothetical protein
MRLSATSHTHIHAHRTHTKATPKHFQQRSHQKRSPCSHRRPVSMLAHIPSARILSRLHATNTTAPLLRRTRLTKRLPTRQAGISSLTCRAFGFAGVQACPRVGQQLQGGASGSLMAWLAEERVGVRERDVSSFKSCMEASPSLPEILQQATPAPDARYRVTSVPFLFRISNLLHRPLSCPPYPSLPSVRGAFDVSNRYRPRRTSDARFPAPWSL